MVAPAPHALREGATEDNMMMMSRPATGKGSTISMVRVED